MACVYLLGLKNAQLRCLLIQSDAPSPQNDHKQAKAAARHVISDNKCFPVFHVQGLFWGSGPDPRISVIGPSQIYDGRSTVLALVVEPPARVWLTANDWIGPLSWAK